MQPWHRDFPAPEAALIGRRLNSLAFNLTTVDVLENMGPFEIAPGTQWDFSPEFEHGMFPPKEFYPRYEQLAQRKLPRMGDIPTFAFKVGNSLCTIRHHLDKDLKTSGPEFSLN